MSASQVKNLRGGQWSVPCYRMGGMERGRQPALTIAGCGYSSYLGIPTSLMSNCNVEKGLMSPLAVVP